MDELKQTIRSLRAMLIEMRRQLRDNETTDYPYLFMQSQRREDIIQCFQSGHNAGSRIQYILESGPYARECIQIENAIRLGRPEFAIIVLDNMIQKLDRKSEPEKAEARPPEPEPTEATAEESGTGDDSKKRVVPYSAAECTVLVEENGMRVLRGKEEVLRLTNNDFEPRHLRFLQSWAREDKEMRDQEYAPFRMNGTTMGLVMESVSDGNYNWRGASKYISECNARFSFVDGQGLFRNVSSAKEATYEAACPLITDQP